MDVTLSPSSVVRASPPVWIQPAPLPPEFRHLHESELLAGLLFRRGITDPEQVRDFLDTRPRPAPDPYKVPGMAEAVERIGWAIRHREKIGIFGDYDADGVTSVALLAKALAAAMGDDANIVTRLPTRTEGYGLNRTAIDDFVAAGVRLLVAVDCASTDHDGVTYALGRGLDVVILDHHHMTDDGPPGAICVSAYRTARGPYHDLCAVGITYLLVAALAQHGFAIDGSDGHPETSLLDYVAIGSIADVTSTVRINRPLIRDGLTLIRTRPRPGIAALSQMAGLDLPHATSTDIAFKIAPRINAAGRMADPQLALDLLLTGDPLRAGALAAQIETLNNKRRSEAARIVHEAERLVRSEPGWERRPMIFVASENWRHGVLGIAASTLASRFGRPVILLSEEGPVSRGSARSTPGFDIVEALDACGDLLLASGGHSQAAGLTVSNERRAELRESLEALVLASDIEWPAVPSIAIDSLLDLNDLGLETVALIDQLQPFGPGNEQPVFQLTGVPLRQYEVMGRDRSHLRLVLTTPRGQLRAPFFGAAARSRELVGARAVDLAVTLQVGYWNGPRLDIHIKDMRPSSS